MHVRLGGLNLVGLRRRNVPRANIHALRAAYRFMFLDHKEPLHERAKKAAGKWPGVQEVQEVIAFILAEAKRPICPSRVRAAQADED
jgi:UDP-N-acetylglucosamine acyltransferase